MRSPDDGALLIDAAAHGGLGTRHDFGGDIEQCAAVELILKCKAGHLAQNLIFELLHSGIKQFFSLCFHSIRVKLGICILIEGFIHPLAEPYH